MIRKAKLSDVKDMHQLINYHAQRDRMLARSLSEIYESIRDFWVYERKGTILGCGALHVVWGDLCEIKSLAVSEDHHRRGMGSALVRRCSSTTTPLWTARPAS